MEILSCQFLQILLHPKAKHWSAAVVKRLCLVQRAGWLLPVLCFPLSWRVSILLPQALVLMLVQEMSWDRDTMLNADLLLPSVTKVLSTFSCPTPSLGMIFLPRILFIPCTCRLIWIYPTVHSVFLNPVAVTI